MGGLWRDVLVGGWPCERSSRHALDEVLSDGGARAYLLPEERREAVELPFPWEPEVFLSILRERAGRLEMVSAAGRALDSAMCWDCGRRRKLRGRCCLGCCCRDRQLEADGGGFRSFGEFAEISRLLWLQGEARSGQVSALRRCRNLQWWVWI